MKKKLVLTTLFFAFFASIYSQTIDDFRPLSYEEADVKADSLLNLMTLDEKLEYIGGDNLFYTQEIKRLKIPGLLFSDATQGIRLNPTPIYKGWKKPVKKTIAYPSPILLASTWNKELTYQYAHSIGEECRAANNPVLLGPGFNIYRNSQCGRNFEYFGEDPFLVSRLIENYVKGLQSTGTIATLKHFVANQTDYFRKRSNSVLDERTLHEIYLPAFKSGIDAGARAVMTAYNQVNGEWAGQSASVINNLLREELDFKWLVMTDWWSVYDGKKLIKSGQDLEMPYRKATKDAEELLEEGKIEVEDIDRMVNSILRTFISMHSFEGEKQVLSEEDYTRLEEIALNTAREGIVLLRNDKNLLPIEKSKKQNILATGDFLSEMVSGGGAAKVKGYDNLSLKEALMSEFGEQISFVKKPSDEEIKSAELVIFSTGTRDSEGSDRPFNLPADQEELLRKYTSINQNTIVLVTSGSGINMSAWKNAHSIIYTWYMGQNGATAVAEILSGKVNPSGKLPVTIEKKFEDSPAFGYIPEGEELYTGFGKGSKKHPVYDVSYDEGIFMGYRWYDQNSIEPEFCFGHGLSYTSFAYSDIELSSKRISESENLIVSFTVKNTGKVDGAEIVQLYVHDRECSVPRPPKELKGFEKVLLKAGESRKVSIELKPGDFAFWDPETKEWTVEEGEFEVLVGASSRDIRLMETIKVM